MGIIYLQFKLSQRMLQLFIAIINSFIDFELGNTLPVLSMLMFPRKNFTKMSRIFLKVSMCKEKYQRKYLYVFLYIR